MTTQPPMISITSRATKKPRGKPVGSTEWACQTIRHHMMIFGQIDEEKGEAEKISFPFEPFNKPLEEPTTRAFTLRPENYVLCPKNEKGAEPEHFATSWDDMDARWTKVNNLRPNPLAVTNGVVSAPSGTFSVWDVLSGRAFANNHSRTESMRLEIPFYQRGLQYTQKDSTFLETLLNDLCPINEIDRLTTISPELQDPTAECATHNLGAMDFQIAGNTPDHLHLAVIDGQQRLTSLSMCAAVVLYVAIDLGLQLHEQIRCDRSEVKQLIRVIEALVPMVYRVKTSDLEQQIPTLQDRDELMTFRDWLSTQEPVLHFYGSHEHGEEWLHLMASPAAYGVFEGNLSQPMRIVRTHVGRAMTALMNVGWSPVKALLLIAVNLFIKGQAVVLYHHPNANAHDIFDRKNNAAHTMSFADSFNNEMIRNLKRLGVSLHEIEDCQNRLKRLALDPHRREALLYTRARAATANNNRVDNQMAVFRTLREVKTANELRAWIKDVATIGEIANMTGRTHAQSETIWTKSEVARIEQIHRYGNLKDQAWLPLFLAARAPAGTREPLLLEVHRLAVITTLYSMKHNTGVLTNKIILRWFALAQQGSMMDVSIEQLAAWLRTAVDEKHEMGRPETVKDLFRAGLYLFPRKHTGQSMRALAFNLDAQDFVRQQRGFLGDAETTIEHVLSQTITAPQRAKYRATLSSLSDEAFEETLPLVIGSVGNMIPLQGGENTAASNRSFADKKEMYKRFSGSFAEEFSRRDDFTMSDAWNRSVDILKATFESLSITGITPVFEAECRRLDFVTGTT